MNLERIEKEIDMLEANDRRKHEVKKNKSFKRTRKLKGLPLAGIVLTISAIIAVAGFFNFFVTVDTDVNTETLLFWNSENAEELVLERTIDNATAGNVYTFENDVLLNSNAQGNRTVSFNFVNDSEILCKILIDGLSVEEYEFSPDVEVTVTEEYTIAHNATNGAYNTVLTVDIA